MNGFAYLDTLDADSFERERNKIIAAEILKAPPEHRIGLLAMQYQLDMRRDRMTREEFMSSLFVDITENLENLTDQFVALGHQLGLKPNA